jgi:hypothetical protein
MDQTERYQRIVTFVKQKGPSFPIDIANLLGSDSIIAAALLSEMVSKNYVKKSNRRIGDSLLYYTDGQGENVRRRLFETLDENEKRLVQKFETSKILSPQELEPMERYIINDLRDFIIPLVVTYKGTDISFFKFHSILDNEIHALLEKKIKPTEKSETPKIPEISKRQVSQKTIVPKKQQPIKKPDIRSDVREKALQTISKLRGRILNEKVIRKDREMDFLVEMTDIGTKHMFKVRNKKTITDKDISLAFAQVMEKKLPMVLLVTGNLSKKAQKYKDDSCGDLIKIVNI